MAIPVFEQPTVDARLPIPDQIARLAGLLRQLEDQLSWALSHIEEENLAEGFLKKLKMDD